MRHSFKGNIHRALLLSNLCFKLLLFGLSFLFLFLCRLHAFGSSISLCDLSGRGSRSGRFTTFDGNFLLFGPKLTHFDTLELRDLVDIVLDANGQFCRATFHVLFSALATAHIVLRDRRRQTCHDLGLITIVDFNGHLSLFVVKFELLYQWELLTQIEEVTVFFWVLSLSCFQIGELVVDRNRHVVIVLHSEVLNVEVRSDHG